MRYLHTMVRVKDLEKSLEFYCEHLGLKELNRFDSDEGRFTLVFLCAQGDDWWSNIWDSSVIIGPDLGSSCDFLPDDEYANYGFTIDGSDLEIFIDESSCELVCDNCSECMPGDTNDDQDIDVLDVVFIVGIILGNNTPDAEEFCGGDYNEDGTIDILDVVAMVSTILG